MSSDDVGDLVKKPDPDDVHLFSSTTILKVLGSEALIYWAAEETAKAAVKAYKSLPVRIEEDGPDETIRWLRDARYRTVRGQRTAAELGTDCHQAFQEYALSGVRPHLEPGDEVIPYLDQFDRWCQEFQPAYEAAEMTVYSPTYGYAGTLDAIATVGGMPLVIDYKTSRKSVDKKGKHTSPYPEAALQVASYRFAERAVPVKPRRHELNRRRYYLWGRIEQEASIPVPEVEGGLVLHVTPEHCHAHPVACGQRTYEAFLAVLDVARWMYSHGPASVSDPIVPVPQEA